MCSNDERTKTKQANTAPQPLPKNKYHPPITITVQSEGPLQVPEVNLSRDKTHNFRPCAQRRCELQNSLTKRLRDLSREKNTFPGTLVLEKTGTDASHLLRPWAQIRNAPSPTALNPQDPKPQTHRHHRQAQEVMRGQRTDPLTTPPLLDFGCSEQPG